MNLDTVFHDILREIVSHLDVGHIISLTQVNRALRNVLINDNYLWSSRLRYGLNVRGISQKTLNSFHEITTHIPTRRCSDCLNMEDLSPRPFIDIFFKKTLCNNCKAHPKYALVTASTAKKNYFLNDNDLLHLRTMSMNNPHHKNASPCRLYSREQIRAISQQKLTSQGVSRENRLQQQEARRKRAIEAHMKSRRCRRKELLGALKTHGLMLVSCRMAYKFIHGGWKDRRDGIRWTVDDVVEHFHEKTCNRDHRNRLIENLQTIRSRTSLFGLV